jgi:hypothetical protein
MRRARRGIVGVLLAMGVGVAAHGTPVQAVAPWLGGQQAPVRKVAYEENTVLSEANARLEEMKVEVALLSDIATFPYYLGAQAGGETIELHGYVPNNLVRQRAVQLARRSTFLTVKDNLTVQVNLSTRPPLRPALVLQKEGAELLLKHFNDEAGAIHLNARPNGLMEVSGTIDSMESKLAVSRLFRQLSGCFGVVNDLKVQQVLRDGQRVVQVSRDGSLVVDPAALGMQSEPVAASPATTIPKAPRPAPTSVAPAPLPEPTRPSSPSPRVLPPPRPEATTLPSPHPKATTLPPPRPTMPPPTPLPRKSLDAPEDELRLPSAPPTSPAGTPTPPSTPIAYPERLPAPPATSRNTPTTSAPVKVGSAPDAPTAPKPPLKWGHPSTNWETQMKTIEKWNAPTTAAAKTTAAAPTKPSTALPSARPIAASPSAKPSAALPNVKLNTALPSTKTSAALPRILPIPVPANQPARTTKTEGPSKPNTATHTKNGSRFDFAATHNPTPPPMTWRQPGGSEASESREPSVMKKPESFQAAPPTPMPRTTPRTLSSQRRWPPAYAPSPPPSSNGKPGVIIFDVEPAPMPAPAPAPLGASRAIAPTDLQHRIQSLCGRQAREVRVETATDGGVLVKVKVPNLSVEDQLTRKILTLPEMTKPGVRLLMDVGP